MIFEFLNYCYCNLHLSQSTIRAYGNALRSFTAFATTNINNPRWSTMSVKDIDFYVSWMTEKGYSQATIGQHIVALRQIYEYFIHEERLMYNPVSHVRSPKKNALLPNVVDLSKVKKAIEEVKSPVISFVLAVMMSTGCRVSEARCLSWSDVHIDRKEIVFNGKGGRQRVAPLSPIVTDCLSRIDKTGSAIVDMDDRSLRYEIFKAIGKSSHSIRHAFATKLVDLGVNLEQIRVMLGHSSIISTQRYLHASASVIRNEFERINSAV